MKLTILWNKFWCINNKSKEIFTQFSTNYIWFQWALCSISAYGTSDGPSSGTSSRYRPLQGLHPHCAIIKSSNTDTAMLPSWSKCKICRGFSLLGPQHSNCVDCTPSWKIYRLQIMWTRVKVWIKKVHSRFF